MSHEFNLKTRAALIARHLGDEPADDACNAAQADAFDADCTCHAVDGAPHSEACPVTHAVRHLFALAGESARAAPTATATESTQATFEAWWNTEGKPGFERTGKDSARLLWDEFQRVTRAAAPQAGLTDEGIQKLVSGVREFILGYLSSHVKDWPTHYDHLRSDRVTDILVSDILERVATAEQSAASPDAPTALDMSLEARLADAEADVARLHKDKMDLLYKYLNIEAELRTLSAPPVAQPESDAQVGLACLEKLRSLMTRLGIYPGDGMEWFAAHLEDNVYAVVRATNALLDTLTLTPQPATSSESASEPVFVRSGTFVRGPNGIVFQCADEKKAQLTADNLNVHYAGRPVAQAVPVGYMQAANATAEAEAGSTNP
ncbi:hypothetical protein F6X40_36340 [Paraburkholderia sp. UCT31]|uniref:hypothetical protein n=1 Tax=Paraburkholderia sp. UCT31 TaxID=2615209 RepID=UPI001654ECCF|nr:hypothetical protein [Paraburkholderia sp. UCT31]MBC8742011.1 hypothetical protein [Paraburkholderia sp. UCT31]